MCGRVVWATDLSDELALWVESKHIPAADSGASASVEHIPAPVPLSGASPRVPTEKLQAAADVVVRALPLLTEAGVLVAIALRAMAAAINAIDRSRGRATFAGSWPAEQLALGFLSGALKFESITSKDDSPCVVFNLQASLVALQHCFGFSKEHHKKMAIAFDCVFCDTDLGSVDCGVCCGEPSH